MLDLFFPRWRAVRAIRTRSAPSPVEDMADPLLLRAVEELKPIVASLESLGDPTWHYRWDGELQLVGLDATRRSTSDVRQRLTRLVFELLLMHMGPKRRRVLAVVLCEPERYGGLRGFAAAVDEDQGEVGTGDWRAARRRVALLCLDRQGGHHLQGGDRGIEEAVARWAKR